MSMELPVTGDWVDAHRVERVQKGTDDGALVVHVVTYSGGQMTVPLDGGDEAAQEAMRADIIHMVKRARGHRHP